MTVLNGLRAIAPVWLVETRSGHYVEDAEANIRQLGALFNAEATVEGALAEIDGLITDVRRLAEQRAYATLVLLTNDGKISVYGSGSRFGIVHDELGLPQADSGIQVGVHGQLVNYEYISMKNPDLILVVDRSAAVSDKADGMRILDNELVNGTTAGRSGRIVPLDPNIWYLSGNGLHSLRVMVNEVRAALEK